MQVQWKHKHAHVICMSIIHSYLDVLHVCLHHVQSVCINKYSCQKYSLVTTHRGVSHNTVPWYSYTHQPCDSHMTDSLMIQLYTCLWDSPLIGCYLCPDITGLSSWRHRVPLLPGYLPRDVSSSVRPVRMCVCTCVFGREGGAQFNMSSSNPFIHSSIHSSFHLPPSLPLSLSSSWKMPFWTIKTTSHTFPPLKDALS